MVNQKNTKLIFLFPGQGSQYPGMAMDLVEISAGAKKVFDTASAVTGKDMIQVVRDSDEETLRRTDISQISLSAASLAAVAYLKEKGIVPAACAGFSLGEYPALAASGVIGMEDCFRLTEERGKAMQKTIEKIRDESPGEEPGMAAVTGLSPEQIENLLAEWKIKDLYAANINSPKQTVVSGSARALAEAEKRFKENGARRFLQLQVAGPFHSPFMNDAADAFAPLLEKITFNNPAIPFFSNVTGKEIKSGEEAKVLALKQITSSVQWTLEEASLLALESEALLETGPGNVLQGLWRSTGSTVPCYAAGSVTDINKFVQQFLEQ